MDRAGRSVEADDFEFAATESVVSLLSVLALGLLLRRLLLRGQVLIFLPARPERISHVKQDDRNNCAKHLPHRAHRARRFLFRLFQHDCFSPAKTARIHRRDAESAESSRWPSAIFSLPSP